MFTWICPQCQGEVLPSQDECPRCAKAAAPVQPPAAQASEPVVPQAIPTVSPAVSAPAPAPSIPAPVQYAPPPEHRSTGLRDTIVTLGVAAVLLGGGYFYWTKGERAEMAARAPKTTLENAKGAKSTHPLAKQIEVTGIRLRVPKTGQAEVVMVVVNHSAADIVNLAMDVVLNAKGTNKEVAVMSVVVKKLGPFGSTEVTTKAKTEVAAIDLPDWQFMEPQVVIQANEP